jgi:rhamnosyltransferase
MVLLQRQHTGRACLKECGGFKMAANDLCKSLDMAQTEAAVSHFVPYPTAANTCIVMVTYNPDAGLEARIDSIRRQADSFVIVDNDSEAEGLALLGVIRDGAGIILIRNNENEGIAAALNRGTSWAIDAGYSWVLLLDQDTVPSPEMLNGLLTAYNDCPIRDKVAIVGSNYIEADAGRLGTPLQLTPSPSWVETPVAITAGSLLSLEAFRLIGPFRVEYFIDCVDMEYCLRVRSKGFKVIVATTPLMVQKIGKPSRYRLPWRMLALSNHSPMRRYYMIRNHVDLAKTYLVSEPSYVLSSLWERLKSTILVCFLEDDRLLKAWYASLGLFDGLFCIFDRELS